MPEPIEIISSLNGGALIFTEVSRDDRETTFLAELRSQYFSGVIETTTYVSGPPTLFFDDLAANWKGWKGEKSWQSIDGGLTLKATSDSTGHIQLTVALEHFLDYVSVNLSLVSGQLNGIVAKAHEVFG